MSIDRPAAGLVVLRISLGVFFIFQAVGKLRWFFDSSVLSGQFSLWAQNAAPDSISFWYLHRVAIPGAVVLARVVPLAEFVCGLALLTGFVTRLFAAVAFLLVLNYQIADGSIFNVSVLANRSVLPVLAGTLALAIGGVRLPWSLRL
jgi:uncharacterized membrane protein YphA (DoxX/SURF4 family)